MRIPITKRTIPILANSLSGGHNSVNKECRGPHHALFLKPTIATQKNPAIKDDNPNQQRNS